MLGLDPSAIAKSGLPSPLRSPTAMDTGPFPVAKVVGAPHVPSPLPNHIETVLLDAVATISSLPSPLKSATAILVAALDIAISLGAWKLPSPLPSRIST